MAKHLRFDLLWSAYNGIDQAHPKVVMAELGIRYQHSTPQSLGDCWDFWNCENIPDPLPPYLQVMEIDPMTCVGYGLTLSEAERIRDYKP